MRFLRRVGHAPKGGATTWRRPFPKASRRREDARRQRAFSSFFFVRGGGRALPDDDDDAKTSSSSLWKEDPVAAVFKRMYAPNAGKRIAYGIFQKPIDDFSANNGGHLTEEEKEKLREKASKEMTVIDEEERKRRGTLCSLFFENGALCISFLFVFCEHLYFTFCERWSS